jgi:hypothetical protein
MHRNVRILKSSPKYLDNGPVVIDDQERRHAGPPYSSRLPINAQNARALMVKEF